MGLFWDLLQQSQIEMQSSSTESLEERVATLESQLGEMRADQRKLLEVLETHSDRDINRDGNIG